MPVIDFTEMPQANKAGGQRDTFEFFSRDFLESLGYKILEGPDRGPDAGRDLIAFEVRKGVAGESHIHWLVSCKHFAHSGDAVGVDHELNIVERVEQNGCNAFLGFYSTLPSSALTTRLEALSNKLDYQFFDREQIESHLLGSIAGHALAKRYFPISFAKWTVENPKPAKVFSDQETLSCEVCGKDLLNPKSGIIVLWFTTPSAASDTRRYLDVCWCCKGDCDRTLQAAHRQHDLIDGWGDIPDICTPVIYIKWIMTILNEHHRGQVYSEHAFDKIKKFLLAIFPYIARETTAAEEEQIKSLLELPAWMGGLGNPR